ncbi:MAG TPA: hypothetical protein DCL53_11185 [Thauera sp.]|jgi:uncharacterized protein YjeT (DUF2065 family)|uniref:hypothetical protein n=1 Tax=Achromobacter ruhlandii TaxID=72557 RepID=UPI000EDB1A33|nr:hypothetical protein [Achromobacter ruhlandii]CAB3699335.1 hypothetical protein LMG1866_02481 [Achromobacter ruhlandii]HAG76003.1 hypothetical protein [Thauera sp.]
MESAAFEQEVRRIEALIQVLEGLPDPTAREAAKELLQVVLDLHGKGLARILKLVSETGTAGQTLLDAMAKDDQVRGLLLLHGLPPDDAEVRVRQALDSVASHLRIQGIGVALMQGLSGGPEFEAVIRDFFTRLKAGAHPVVEVRSDA